MEIIAHRGMHGDGVEENSEQAFKGVLASIADGIETDIRLTFDDVCIVYHDSKTLDSKSVIDTSFADIVEMQDHVMRIEHALEILQNYQGIVNIEIKHILGERGKSRGRQCVEKLKNALEDFNIPNLLISSFSIKNLKSARKNMPTVDRAYLVPYFIPLSVGVFIAKMLQCRAIHFYKAQMRWPLAKYVIRRAHKHNLKVRVHTINTVEDLSRLKNLGVDGVVTDEVVVLSEQ